MLGWLRNLRICVRKRFCRDFEVTGRPFVPFFPMIATAPARHDQHTHFIGEVEKFIAFQFSFQANGVQVHVANVAELCLELLPGAAQKHVGGPPCATDEYFLAIDSEEQRACVRFYDFTRCKVEHLSRLTHRTVQFRGNLSNTEPNILLVGNCPINDEACRERIEILRPERSGPPQLWFLHSQLRKLFGTEADRTSFPASSFTS